jgi:hypothetical protein
MPESINEIPARSNRIKVTKRSVESLPSGVRAAIWYDDKLAGFGVRVMPTGRRFYFARYRNQYGRSRWFTIGEHGKVTADAARSKAQRVLQTVAVDGSDPSGEREAFRAAPTVNDLLDRYIKEHIERRNRARTQTSFKGIIDRNIRPELGHLKVAAVTRQDMHRFHAALAALSGTALRALPLGRGAGPSRRHLARRRNGRSALEKRWSNSLPPSGHRRDRASVVHRLSSLGGAEPTIGAYRFRCWHNHTARNQVRPPTNGDDE